jgi:hypothetical protein
MRNYIDENDKKNEIRLLFKHPLYKGKVICVVEGQSDVRLFRKLLKHDDLKLETVDGKKDLIKVMKELSVEFPEQILAICDADFEHLTGESFEYKDFSVFTTDYHDAEILMLNSLSLITFIHEYTANDKVDLLCENLYEKVTSAGYLIGLLRWINYSEKLKLNFKGLNFNEFIDVSNFTITIDLDVLIQSLLKRSQAKLDFINEEYLIEKLEEYKLKNGCLLQVCCGHDLTNIISMVYRNKWASLETNMEKNKVEAALRIGYQHNCFANTKLGKELKYFLSPFSIELFAC